MSIAYTKQKLACYLEGSPCLFTAVIKNSWAVDALLFMATFKYTISEDICASFIWHQRRHSSTGLYLGFICLCEDLLFILMGNIIQLLGCDAGLRATCWAHYLILWPFLGFCWSYKESRSGRNKNRLIYLLQTCVRNSPFFCPFCLQVSLFLPPLPFHLPPISN